MPCHDPAPFTNISEVELDRHKERINYLEACVCALMSELDKTGMSDIVDSAEQNGKVNIKQVWEQHKKKDEARLKSKFAKFSKHEQSLLKQMIKEGKL